MISPQVFQRDFRHALYQRFGPYNVKYMYMSHTTCLWCNMFYFAEPRVQQFEEFNRVIIAIFEYQHFVDR